MKKLTLIVATVTVGVLMASQALPGARASGKAEAGITAGGVSGANLI